MKKSTEAYQQYQNISDLEDISHILESVASIRIRQIKDQVMASREFFRRLWTIYSQLRVSDEDTTLLRRGDKPKIDRSSVILVTANQGLTGEIDSRLVDAVLSQTDSAKVDYFVIGAHGESLLKQRGVTPKQTFRLPELGSRIEVSDIVEAVSQYVQPIVYYQSFVSLTSQQVVYFSLVETVHRLTESERQVHPEELIYPDECLFEPSVEVVVSYLESMMIGATLTEVILESSLAQLASRFEAMNAAGGRAQQTEKQLLTKYSQLRRYERDELSRHYNRRRKAYS